MTMPDITEAEEPVTEATEPTGEVENPSTEGTEPTPTVQNDAATESEEEPDPLDAYYAARLAEEQANLEEKVRARLLEEQRAQAELARQTRAQEEAAERSRNAFSLAAKQTSDMLKGLKIYDENRDELSFSDEAIQTFIQPWQNYNREVAATAEARVYGELGVTAMGLLPEEAHENFAKNAADKDLKTYLSVYAESKAPSTEFVKKLLREQETKIAAAEARGYARGQKAPQGTPQSIPDRGIQPSSEFDLTTISGAAGALAAGQIDAARYREIVRTIR